MDISMESFHTGGTKTGAILRRQEATRLTCLTVHRDGEGLHRTELELVHDGDVRGWTAFTCTTSRGAVTVRRVDPTTLEVEGRTVPVPEDTLPTLAAPVLLGHMLAGSHTEEELHTLDETDPATAPVAGHFSVGNPETVPLPGQGPVELGTVTLYRGERPTDRFWFDSHDVVASDWQGPRSYHVASLDDLLDGLDPEVVASVHEFLA